MDILNKVKTSKFIDRTKLVNFQGNLKKQDNDNKISKLAERIKTKGFSAPIFIWANGQNYILDGHQRLKALNLLAEQDYFLEDDKVPVVEIEAKTKKEAKETLLEYNSKYSEFDLEELGEFSIDLDLENLGIDDLDNIDFGDGQNINNTNYEGNIENVENADYESMLDEIETPNTDSEVIRGILIPVKQEYYEETKEEFMKAIKKGVDFGPLLLDLFKQINNENK